MSDSTQPGSTDDRLDGGASSPPPELIEPATPPVPEPTPVEPADAVVAEPASEPEPEPTPLDETGPAPDVAPDAPTLTTADVPPGAATPVDGAAQAETDAAPAAPVTPVATPASVPPQEPRVVYVAAPVPPKPKGNRFFGTLLAIVSTVLFAVLYGGVGVFIAFTAVLTPPLSLLDFLVGAVFIVPVVVYLVASILLALIANRAPWALHVFLSIFVGAAVYFASIGLLLLLDNAFALSPGDAYLLFVFTATNPFVVAAGLLAREVTLWTGVLIARRGRRVTAANAEARAAFDREQAAKRAEYEAASA